LQPGKVGDTQDDRTGIIMRPMMVGWEVTATKERARERETNIQIGLLGQESLRRKAATDRNNNNNKKERKKEAKEAHRPRSTIMRQKWGFFFPAFTMPGIYIQVDLTCLSALHDIYQDSGKTTNTDHDKSIRDG
jgi:hypothetical protein